MLPLLALAGGSALGGLASGYFQGEAVKDASRAEAEAQRRALAEAREASEEGMGYIRPYEQAGFQALQDLTAGLQSGDYETDVNDFQYGKGVQDFLDPSMQFQHMFLASKPCVECLMSTVPLVTELEPVPLEK